MKGVARLSIQLSSILFVTFGADASSEGNCVDTAAVGEVQCRDWAWHGECDRNPDFMHSECRKSCKICTDAEAAEPVCQDSYPQCSEWAELGRCFGFWEGQKGEHAINNAYVIEFCPESCGVCDIHLDVRDYGLLMGFPQTAPDMDEPFMRQRVIAKVQEARNYVETLDPEVRDVCKFGHINCARWGLGTECEEKADHDIFKYLCAATCQTCEIFTDPVEKDKAIGHYHEAIDEVKKYLEYHQNKAERDAKQNWKEW